MTESASTPTVDDAPGNGSITVLLGTPGSSGDDRACMELATAGAPSRTDLLTLALDRDPDECLEAWRTHVGPECPANFAVVSAGDCARSAAADGANGGPAASGGGLRIETVDDPGSPVDLGVAVTGHLSAWADNGNRTVVCLHSVTALLDHLAEPRVFRFLHALAGRIRRFGADAHFHFDPSAHGTGTGDRLTALADDVVETMGQPDSA